MIAVPLVTDLTCSKSLCIKQTAASFGNKVGAFVDEDCVAAALHASDRSVGVLDCIVLMMLL